jgi:hypothetical protein
MSAEGMSKSGDRGDRGDHQRDHKTQGTETAGAEKRENPVITNLRRQHGGPY